jgi:hypothetical protein
MTWLVPGIRPGRAVSGKYPAPLPISAEKTESMQPQNGQGRTGHDDDKNGGWENRFFHASDFFSLFLLHALVIYYKGERSDSN